MSSTNNNNNNNLSTASMMPVDTPRNLFLENLDLHISRISSRTTPEHISRTLYEMSICDVDYVDIVATKDPATKAILYYSAFVRLIRWGPDRFPPQEFDEKKIFKIYLGRYSSDSAEKYWVLYPNKNPLPRTRVNVHQLAASTEKLFEQDEQFTVTIASQQAQIEALKTSLQQCETNFAKQMEQMMALIKASLPPLVVPEMPKPELLKRCYGTIYNNTPMTPMQCAISTMHLHQRAITTMHLHPTTYSKDEIPPSVVPEMPKLEKLVRLSAVVNPDVGNDYLTRVNTMRPECSEFPKMERDYSVKHEPEYTVSEVSEEDNDMSQLKMSRSETYGLCNESYDTLAPYETLSPPSGDILNPYNPDKIQRGKCFTQEDWLRSTATYEDWIRNYQPQDQIPPETAGFLLRNNQPYPETIETKLELKDNETEDIIKKVVVQYPKREWTLPVPAKGSSSFNIKKDSEA
jgi:hypothetical protein